MDISAGVGVSLLTVGHSNRDDAELVALLRRHDVETVADIRRYPGSRRQPRFGAEALARTLAAAGIAYIGLPSLGGRRRVQPGSPNGGWLNPAFQGYADYMAADEFRAGVAELLAVAATTRTCVMCAEALPWRCHRWLLADWLTVHGASVAHVLGPGPARPHRLSPFAHVDSGLLHYPPVGGADEAG